MIKKYQLKDGSTRYLVQVYAGKDSKGNSKKTTRKGFKTIKEAKIAEARLIKNPPSNGVTKDNATYNDIYKLWLDQYENRVRESTLHKTMTMFRLNITPNIGHKQIDKITPYEIQQLVNEWSEKFVEFKFMVNYMNSIFKKAKKLDFIKESPVDRIDIPLSKKVSKREIENFYSKSELNTFLAVAEKRGLKWYALFKLLAYSGMRQGELLALVWSDIDFNNHSVDINKALTRGIGNQLIIQPPKTKASKRLIPLDSGTIKVLKQWQIDQRKRLLISGQRAKQQLVFPVESTNKFMTTSQIRKNMKAIQEETNLPEITAHGFRHTHCSLLFEAGVQIEVVKERLGHSDIQTTMNIYTHVTKEIQTEVANIFTKFMEN